MLQLPSDPLGLPMLGQQQGQQSASATDALSSSADPSSSSSSLPDTSKWSYCGRASVFTVVAVTILLLIVGAGLGLGLGFGLTSSSSSSSSPASSTGVGGPQGGATTITTAGGFPTSTPTASPTSAPPNGNNPTSAPPSTGLAASMVHFLPLQGNFNDQVSGASSYVLQGNSGCSSIGSTGWTQSCSNTGHDASLQLTDPTESGDVSMCVAVKFASFPLENSYIWGCDGFFPGTVDCVAVWQFGGNSLNWAVSGVSGASVNHAATLVANQWTHVCATYVFSSATFVMYQNGASLRSFGMAHHSGSFGTPVLGAEGLPSETDGVSATLATFANWRVWTRAITSSEVSSVYASDLPS